MHTGESIGKYRLKNRLAKGGQGEVWLAEDTGLIHREVAVKVIFSRSSELATEKLTQEAVVMARMYHHPNLPVFYDVLEVPFGVAMVMEYLPGYNLSQLLDHRPLGLSWPDLAAIAEGLLLGLAHSHRYEVVHRDLKPGNIQIFNPMGTMRPIRVKDVKVLDFGIAINPQDQRHDPNILAGTLPYMSPEMVDGVIQGQTSDIHACGVILFELITGKHPIPFPPQANSRTIMECVAKHHPEPPSKTRADCPAALDRWLLKALQKSPDKRPSTAEVLAKGILPSLRRMAKQNPYSFTSDAFGGDPFIQLNKSHATTSSIQKRPKLSAT